MEFPTLKNFSNGVVIEIKDDPFTIGRALSCSYIIPNAQISREHCSLRKSENGWLLYNSSSNGTYVNGSLLSPKYIMKLKHGDIISFSPESDKYIFQEQISVPTDKISDEELNLIADSVQEFSSPSPATFLNTASTTISNIVPHSSRSEVVIEKKNILKHQTNIDSPNTKRIRADNPTTSNIPVVEVTTIPVVEATTIPVVEATKATSNATLDHNKDQEEKQVDVELNPPENNEEMEDELMCSICSELFIRATTLNCSHTYCKSCIELWKKTNSICPICRAGITVMTPTLVLDNVIDRIIQSSTDEIKEHRNKIIEERKQEEVKRQQQLEQEQQNAQNYYNYRGRGRGRSRSYRGGGNRGVVNRGGRGRGRGDYPNRIQNRDVNPAVVNLVSSESDSEEGDSYISTSGDGSESDESNEWDDGLPGVYYGGYGRCYNCGRRGHWNNGCPWR